jgi:hypothetical protein
MRSAAEWGSTPAAAAINAHRTFAGRPKSTVQANTTVDPM